ncbi:hypothetical protein [Litorihabitans aurantiacus]|uniref:Uncharacterized protein n=1 Tax=Litorihabitans aurantiacus TaxID=1930061 RepID=A0AA37XEA5_9MICO|nr:hypothetical protein [Litorihabitans aurantiacus]GMA31588.1 hypothetical protein GCM10025875_15800 [Litorihabitans aurantiacus]
MFEHEHEHVYAAVATFDDVAGPRSWSPCTVCGVEPVLCAVCSAPTPTSVPIHDGCLATEREVLDEIARIVAAWPEPIREILTAVAYDISGVTSVDDKARLPFGLDAVTDDWFHHAAGVRTTGGALELLEEWRRAWVDAGAGGHSVDDPHDVVAYLRSRLVWAATNPTRSGFTDYRTEARTVRARLRTLHGDGTETVGGARCLACDGPLAHVRAVGVLDDLATCQRCSLAYDVAATARTLRARIATSPDQAPDALVTEPEARRIFAELAPATIRKWVQRGRLHAAGSRSGSATYRVGDIAVLARPRHAATTSADVVAT